MTVFDLDKHEPIAFLAMADDSDVNRFDPSSSPHLRRLLQRSDFGISSR